MRKLYSFFPVITLYWPGEWFACTAYPEFYTESAAVTGYKNKQ